MRAISLWQPWATLIAIGAKSVETRSWATPFRGELVIHAAKTWTRDLQAMCLLSEPFRSALLPLALAAWPDVPGDRAMGGQQALRNYLGRAAGTERGIPLGAYVAHTRLAGCSATEVLAGRVSARERAFGDFSTGRSGWQLEGTVALSAPLRARGRQGFWTLTAAEEAAVRALLPVLEVAHA
jgi:hypothetical protein